MMQYPRISIITPSFNQAKFLEKTIQSILCQNYPNLELIVIDGGSTDGSVEIIKRYADHISYWVSEKDAGQTHAINKGLRMATGEWVSWQNSDDIYYPGALNAVATAIQKNPAADVVIGNIMLIDKDGKSIRDVCYVRPTYGAMLAEGMVLTNQAAFWRRQLHDQIGFLDETLHYAFDYEWFLRAIKDRRTVHVNRILGGYRLHENTKTHNSAPRFKEENQLILRNRQVPGWLVYAYQIRRLFLLLAYGNIRYVVRGLWRRGLLRAGRQY